MRQALCQELETVEARTDTQPQGAYSYTENHRSIFKQRDKCEM